MRARTSDFSRVEPSVPPCAQPVVFPSSDDFRLSWRFLPEVVISPRPGPFEPLRRFHPVEGFSPRRGVPPHSSSFPRPSYPPQSSCLSPPRHLFLKPTLLPMKPCFSPEWYLHTSPDNQRNLVSLPCFGATAEPPSFGSMLLSTLVGF